MRLTQSEQPGENPEQIRQSAPSHPWRRQAEGRQRGPPKNARDAGTVTESAGREGKRKRLGSQWFHLLGTGEVVPGVLGSPVPNSHGLTGESPVKGHENHEATGASLL